MIYLWKAKYKYATLPVISLFIVNVYLCAFESPKMHGFGREYGD